MRIPSKRKLTSGSPVLFGDREPFLCFIPLVQSTIQRDGEPRLDVYRLTVMGKGS